MDLTKIMDKQKELGIALGKLQVIEEVTDIIAGEPTYEQIATSVAALDDRIRKEILES